MSEKPKSSEEEALRESIRAEIEQRDLKRSEAQRKKESQKLAGERTELKRRIYREEMERYYSTQPGYRKIIGEDGEPEWVHEDEAQENEHLFEEVFEDPLEGRKKQNLRLIIFAFVFLAVLVGFYSLLYQGKGDIQVTCNVAGSQIILDAAPTRYYTDDTLIQVSAGEHYVTVEREGYRIVGETVVRVEVKRGQTHRVTFVLEPAEGGGESSVSGASSSTTGMGKP